MDARRHSNNSAQRRRRNETKRNKNIQIIGLSKHHIDYERNKKKYNARTIYDEDIRRCLQDLEGIQIETLIIEKELTNAKKEEQWLNEVYRTGIAMSHLKPKNMQSQQ